MLLSTDQQRSDDAELGLEASACFLAGCLPGRADLRAEPTCDKLCDSPGRRGWGYSERCCMQDGIVEQIVMSDADVCMNERSYLWTASRSTR